MAFINEVMKADDVQRFNIERIDDRFKTDGIYSRSWAVDRDRNMYLRCVARLGKGMDTQSVWTFYWYEELLKVVLEMYADCKQSDDLNYPGWKLANISEFDNNELSPGLQPAEIMEDLQQALEVFQPGLDDPDLDAITTQIRQGTQIVTPLIQDALKKNVGSNRLLASMNRIQTLRDNRV